MASAWGKSWGKAWGNAWGDAGGEIQVPPTGGGGGGYSVSIFSASAIDPHAELERRRKELIKRNNFAAIMLICAGK